MELLSRTAQGEKKKKSGFRNTERKCCSERVRNDELGGEEGGETEVEMQSEAREM